MRLLTFFRSMEKNHFLMANWRHLKDLNMEKDVIRATHVANNLLNN